MGSGSAAFGFCDMSAYVWTEWECPLCHLGLVALPLRVWGCSQLHVGPADRTCLGYPWGVVGWSSPLDEATKPGSANMLGSMLYPLMLVMSGYADQPLSGAIPTAHGGLPAIAPGANEGGCWAPAGNIPSSCPWPPPGYLCSLNPGGSLLMGVWWLGSQPLLLEGSGGAFTSVFSSLLLITEALWSRQSKRDSPHSCCWLTLQLGCCLQLTEEEVPPQCLLMYSPWESTLLSDYFC